MLAEDARRCVVYLGYAVEDSDDEIEPEGTGFLVALDAHGYLVTARHVAKVLDGSGGEPFVIRMNTKSGEGRVHHVDDAKWQYHNDGELADVAVLSFDAPQWAEVTYFPATAFLIADKIKSKEISCGEAAYVAGVFAPLHGQRRNLPVVHTGAIALLAGDEPIPVRSWEEPLEDSDGQLRIVHENGYLIQVDTLPASSGSPVFITRPMAGIFSDFDDGAFTEDLNKSWRHGATFLLGLWQGAWGDDLGRVISLPHTKVQRSLGMGVAIPADRIMEVLNSPDLKKQRKDTQAKIDRRRAVRVQSAPPTKEDNPSHEADFNRLLGAAARTPKQGGQT